MRRTGSTRVRGGRSDAAICTAGYAVTGVAAPRRRRAPHLAYAVTSMSGRSDAATRTARMP
jgi:hypothetical protein